MNSSPQYFKQNIHFQRFINKIKSIFLWKKYNLLSTTTNNVSSTSYSICSVSPQYQPTLTTKKTCNAWLKMSVLDSLRLGLTTQKFTRQKEILLFLAKKSLTLPYPRFWFTVITTYNLPTRLTSG